jgi:hypothetical protein
MPFAAQNVSVGGIHLRPPAVGGFFTGAGGAAAGTTMAREKILDAIVAIRGIVAV